MPGRREEELETGVSPLGAAVRAWRRYRGLSVTDLALRAGFGESGRGYISKIEHGKIVRIGMKRLAKIADALEISPTELQAYYLPPQQANRSAQVSAPQLPGHEPSHVSLLASTPTGSREISSTRPELAGHDLTEAPQWANLLEQRVVSSLNEFETRLTYELRQLVHEEVERIISASEYFNTAPSRAAKKEEVDAPNSSAHSTAISSSDRRGMPHLPAADNQYKYGEKHVEKGLDLEYVLEPPSFAGASNHDGKMRRPESELDDADESGLKVAFESLWRRYEDKIYRYILGSVGDKSNAEDIFQEVATAAWMNVKAPAARENFEGYLVRTASNKIEDHRRKGARWRFLKRSRGSLSFLGEQEPPHEEHVFGDAILLSCLKEVPDRHRRCFILYILLGHTQDQIAAELGLNPRTVAMHVREGKNSFVAAAARHKTKFESADLDFGSDELRKTLYELANRAENLTGRNLTAQSAQVDQQHDPSTSRYSRGNDTVARTENA